MNEWTDQAIVLRMGHFRDTDIWLKVLFRHKGLLTVFAFGASHSRRRFCGCLDILNTLRCYVRTSGRQRFLNLTEAELLSGPAGLRTNWQRNGLAANCLRFAEALGVNAESAEETFVLMEDLRHTLDGEHELPALLPLFFRLRFACAQGFAPALDHCSVCGAPAGENILFRMDEGQLVCPACTGLAGVPGGGQDRYSVRLPGRALATMRQIQQGLPSDWSSDPMPWQERQAVARAIDGFVQYHLGLMWDNGYFRRV